MSNLLDRQAPANSQPSDWPVGDEGPAGDEHVFVAFHGLFCFGHNEQTGMCEIGTHSKTSDHEFQILVYELGANGEPPRLIYSFKPDSYDTAGGTINIDIGDPKYPGVEFFLPDIPQDGWWRQLIDFERLYS